MGWETRANSRGHYYTRTIRSGDHFRREYIGTGPLAEAAAAQDARRRAERAAAHAQLQMLMAQDEAADASTAAFDAAVEALMRGALVAAGFHQHARGAWRRRRAPQEA